MALIARRGNVQAFNIKPQRLPTRVAVGARAADLVIPVGWALLRAEDDPSLTVVCQVLGKPQPTQGYGGVEETERAGRTSLTTFRGFAAFGYELELELDGTDDDRSVEPAKEVLEALAGRGRRATGGEPPSVIVNTAGAMAHDFTRSPDLRWWVNDLDWSDDEEAVETNAAGDDVLATVTVSVLQRVRDARLEDRALAARIRIQERKKAKRTHIVKQGETLITIARDKLGDPGRWDELGELNGIRDPRSVRPGATIKLP